MVNGTGGFPPVRFLAVEISILLQGDSQVKELKSSEFGQLMGIVYCSQLEFASPKVEKQMHESCMKAEKRGWIDPRQRWLGSYYAQEIQAGRHPPVTVAWIDPALGYGVFANQAIPRHTFVGEYTGLLRKRSLFGRLKNAYCFNYTIGFGRKTPYVIDAREQGNFTRYINHSDEPNLETASVLHQGKMHMIFYATGDIPKGAQLSCDYGLKYWIGRKRPDPLNPGLFFN